MEIKTNKEGLHYREGTSDRQMLMESDINNPKSDYAMLGSFKDLVVMDIGANVGGFAARIADDSKKVVCYEPDESNFEILKMNCDKFPNVELIRAAVIEGLDTSINFYMTGSNNTHCSGSVNKGRKSLVVTVPAINLYTELERVKPDFLKVDIEGSEFDLFDRDLPNYVRGVVIEIHHPSPKLMDKYQTLLDYFKRQFGPEVGRKDVIFFNVHKGSVVYFQRDENFVIEPPPKSVISF